MISCTKSSGKAFQLGADPCTHDAYEAARGMIAYQSKLKTKVNLHCPRSPPKIYIIRFPMHLHQKRTLSDPETPHYAKRIEMKAQEQEKYWRVALFYDLCAPCCFIST